MRVSTRNGIYAGALVVIVTGFGLVPLYFTRRQRAAGTNLMLQEESLGPHQVMRGPYLNTGSHDAGRDNMWQVDKATGKLVYRGTSAVDAAIARGERATPTPSAAQR